MLWSAKLFLATAVMGTGALSQWKNHSSCRDSKDWLSVRGTVEPLLAMREKLCFSSLHLGLVYMFDFSLSLSESSVHQYFNSLIL
jgi:hypothetical protein